VWVLDPDEREVDVYDPGSIRTFTAKDTLEAAAILPGFSVSVARLLANDKKSTVHSRPQDQLSLDSLSFGS
jgi:Uma2 family endonuclease